MEIISLLTFWCSFSIFTILRSIHIYAFPFSFVHCLLSLQIFNILFCIEIFRHSSAGARLRSQPHCQMLMCCFCYRRCDSQILSIQTPLKVLILKMASGINLVCSLDSPNSKFFVYRPLFHLFVSPPKLALTLWHGVIMPGAHNLLYIIMHIIQRSSF